MLMLPINLKGLDLNLLKMNLNFYNIYIVVDVALKWLMFNTELLQLLEILIKLFNNVVIQLKLIKLFN